MANQAQSIPGPASFALGGLAACMAVTFTNPWEVVKTRLQLQGQLQERGSQVRLYRHTLDALGKIYKMEGWRGLQRGLGTAYAFQLLSNGIRVGWYADTKRWLTGWVNAVSPLTPSSPLFPAQQIGLQFSSGAVLGAVGALVGSPLFLVKCRLQSFVPPLSSPFLNSAALPGVDQYAYRHGLHGLASIWSAQGIPGWFQGAPVAMARTAVGSGIQLGSYDIIKNAIKNHHAAPEMLKMEAAPLHFVASMASGVLVCIGMNPLDVLMTRMYNQSTHPLSPRLYRHSWDCLWKTVSTEGFWSLYKGFLPHYVRVGPHTVFLLMFFEQLKGLYVTNIYPAGQLAKRRHL